MSLTIDELLIALVRASELNGGSKRYALTGDRHSGKTTAILDVYRRCQDLGLKPFGLCEVALFDAKGGRLGYDFLELPVREELGQRRIALARRTPNGTRLNARIQMPYHFDDDAFLKAQTFFEPLVKGGIALIDEIGLLELHGKGLWPVFKSLSVTQSLAAVVAVVRRDILRALEEKTSAFDAVCEI